MAEPGETGAATGGRPPPGGRRAPGGRASEHFGPYAGEYRRYRPDYPAALFARLAGLAPGRRALDCATGSGQAARGLAGVFDEVVAVDVSRDQIREARPASSVRYVVAPAERLPLRDASVDAVTVGQALHWLDHLAFFEEVRRVARPGGLFAAWSYASFRIGGDLDPVIDRLYTDILGSYWLPERRHVADGYASIPIPLEPIAVEELILEKRWTLEDVFGYLATWSAGRIYADRHGVEPVSLVRADLDRAWRSHAGESGTAAVQWRLTLRTFRV